MPTTVATPVTVYLHCRNARCGGSVQEEVKGVREETSWSFLENGGDWPFTEKSLMEYKAEDESVLPCRVCGEGREVTGSPRPTYMNLSGHDPMGLLGGMAFDPNKVNTEADAEIAELKAQVTRLAALVEAKADD